ncbi:MAG: histidine phosphatase family protein, partial [Rhodobacteraceae bacterium]|nr:histidine phosphatase family protein [Paracoccaceae bacterium]
MLILRHAKSDWNAGASTDLERPLNKRGRKAAKRIGRWLDTSQFVPESIISSPAVRARQTAVSVAQTVGLPAQAIQWDPAIYGATAPALLMAIRETPQSCRSVMLVGHNPGLEDLLLALCGDDSPLLQGAKLLPTAALAV